jgi:PAS domain S-box-containing protein
MPQIVWTARPDGHLDYYNRRWYDFTGFSPGAGGDDSWIPIVHPDDRQHCMDVWYSAVATGEIFEMNYRFWDQARNSFRWHLGRGVPLRDGLGTIIKWIGTCTDIDDHKRLSEGLEQRVADRTIELNQSLMEKTTLLKEVHHRVKNNLQVICSLLSMQVACSDIALTAPLQEAHHRIVAMSLIHERIYQSETLSDLEFGGYIKSLSGHLFQAYCIDASRVRLDLEVETIYLSIDDAIPCGLILNELLSNSLKHAFPGGRQGIIEVSLRRIEGDRFELAVADSGAGLPANFRIEDTKSLGLQIVRSLVRQLGADLKIGKDTGVGFTLICPLSADIQPPSAGAAKRFASRIDRRFQY